MEEMLEQYKATLSEQELKTLAIAEEHLESSFNIYKSIGFLKYTFEKDTFEKSMAKPSEKDTFEKSMTKPS